MKGEIDELENILHFYEYNGINNFNEVMLNHRLTTRDINFQGKI